MNQENNQIQENNQAEITVSHFNVSMMGVMLLMTKGLDLNHLFVLEQLCRQLSVPEQNKFEDWKQTLVRKGLLTSEFAPTLKAEQLLREVSQGVAETTPVYTKQTDPFEKWWFEAYPGTDAFEYMGRNFVGSQSKRTDKEASRKQFWNAVNELRITPEDIYWATIVQMEYAREKSLQTGISEISHISNSEKYLRNRSFLPFVDAGRERRNTPFAKKIDPFSHRI